MDTMRPNTVPIFFIMGRPRSGTTLLSTLFDAHPNVKIPPEFPIMLPLYQKFRKVKDWDEKAILSFVAFIFQHNVFIHRTLENLKINREDFTANLMTLAHKGTIQDFLKKVNEQGFSLFPKQEIPALLIRTSILPKRSSVFSISLRQSISQLTSV